MPWVSQARKPEKRVSQRENLQIYRGSLSSIRQSAHQHMHVRKSPKAKAKSTKRIEGIALGDSTGPVAMPGLTSQPAHLHTLWSTG